MHIDGRRRFDMVKPIPEGYHTITPYLLVRNAPAAMDYYKKAFGAIEVERYVMPNGKIGHADMKIGDSHFMLADENPEAGYVGPETVGGTTFGIALYVENVDEMFKGAIDAGGKVQRELANQFYGDRTGTLIDPFGHKWTISTHVEDVTPEEMESRAKAAGH
jgi:PhnB protein